MHSIVLGEMVNIFSYRHFPKGRPYMFSFKLHINTEREVLQWNWAHEGLERLNILPELHSSLVVELGFESTSDYKIVFLLCLLFSYINFLFWWREGDFMENGGCNTYISDLIFFLFLCSNQNRHIDGALRIFLGLFPPGKNSC